MKRKEDILDEQHWRLTHSTKTVKNMPIGELPLLKKKHFGKGGINWQV